MKSFLINIGIMYFLLLLLVARTLQRNNHNDIICNLNDFIFKLKLNKMMMNPTNNHNDNNLGGSGISVVVIVAFGSFCFIDDDYNTFGKIDYKFLLFLLCIFLILMLCNVVAVIINILFYCVQLLLLSSSSVW
jgi:hypothetical protein